MYSYPSILTYFKKNIHVSITKIDQKFVPHKSTSSLSNFQKEVIVILDIFKGIDIHLNSFTKLIVTIPHKEDPLGQNNLTMRPLLLKKIKLLIEFYPLLNSLKILKISGWITKGSSGGWVWYEARCHGNFNFKRTSLADRMFQGYYWRARYASHY